MICQEIELEEIDFENDTFRISEQLDFKPVHDSLREIGQLNPVLLLEGHPQKRIVCGFRRLQALKQLDKPRALARFLDPKTFDSRRAFDLALWDNLSHRQLNALEKARVLFKLKNFFNAPEDALAQRYLPCLGLKPNKSVLHSYLLLDGIRSGIRKCFNEGRLTLSSMESLAALPRHMQDLLALLMERIQLSASLQKKVLNLLTDLGAIMNARPEDLLKDAELPGVLDDSRLTPFQRGEKVHEILYRRRFPRVTHAAERFMEHKKSLGLPGSIRLTMDPFFETQDLRVEFSASNVERFRELAAELNRAAQLPELEHLLDVR